MGNRGIFQQIQAGELEAVRALVLAEPTLANARDKRRATPLMEAVRSSSRTLTMVELLLGAGADADARDEVGMSALHWAIDINGPSADFPPICERLVAAGASLEAEGQWGWTPLMRAVISGTAEEVRALLRAGANPEVRFSTGTMPEFARGMSLLEATTSMPIYRAIEAAIATRRARR